MLQGSPVYPCSYQRVQSGMHQDSPWIINLLYITVHDIHAYCYRCIMYYCCLMWSINTLRARQNGRRFAHDTFKRIFLNQNVRIAIKISLKFVPKGPINNNPSLVQIMVWCRSCDKPLSEPIMVSLLTHICVTGPQWVNSSPPRQNGCYFTDDIFNCIFVNEKFCILIRISLKFVPKSPVDINPVLV